VVDDGGSVRISLNWGDTKVLFCTENECTTGRQQPGSFHFVNFANKVDIFGAERFESRPLRTVSSHDQSDSDITRRGDRQFDTFIAHERPEIQQKVAAGLRVANVALGGNRWVHDISLPSVPGCYPLC